VCIVTRNKGLWPKPEGTDFMDSSANLWEGEPLSCFISTALPEKFLHRTFRGKVERERERERETGEECGLYIPVIPGYFACSIVSDRV